MRVSASAVVIPYRPSSVAKKTEAATIVVPQDPEARMCQFRSIKPSFEFSNSKQALRAYEDVLHSSASVLIQDIELLGVDLYV